MWQTLLQEGPEGHATLGEHKLHIMWKTLQEQLKMSCMSVDAGVDVDVDVGVDVDFDVVVVVSDAGQFPAQHQWLFLADASVTEEQNTRQQGWLLAVNYRFDGK